VAALLVAGTSLIPLTSCSRNKADRETPKTSETAAQAEKPSDQTSVAPPAFEVPPEAVTQVRPTYPEDAKKAGAEGVVVLQVDINADGTVASAKAVEEVPSFPSLTESAIAAVMQWKFKPAMDHGKPVPVTVALPIRFRLEGKETT
jgi:protein TonB